MAGALRLSELVATMSSASDMGMGLPDDAAVRCAVLASALAEAAGASDDVRGDAFWISLLRNAGCTADAHLNAAVFEDEIAIHRDMYGVDWGDGLEFLRFLLRRIGNDRPLPGRLAALARTFAGLPALMETGRAHCEVGDRLAERFGLPATTRAALFHVFERWDGTGLPGKLRGEAIHPAARIAAVAQEAEVGHRIGGSDGATTVVRKRRGRRLEPNLVDTFVRHGASICARLDGPSVWPALFAAERPSARTVDDDALMEALAAMGDFADLQSRFTRGHSERVAALARGAAEAARLTRAESVLLERAAWVHDVGRVVVSAGVWDAPRPLTESEWERVRLHPHATERVFARVAALAPIGELAALAHERLDGRGYQRRLPRDAIPPAARLLAACDAYAGMTADRPHRPALSEARAAETLRGEAKAGRLDPDCVEAVLGAAGLRVRARAPHPGALSEREVEVIRLIARGMTNKEIALALGISAKTAGNHVQHVFEKAGVTTRAAAAMFAMQRGLV